MDRATAGFEFVPEDELHRRPAHEVREPDDEAC